MFYTFLQRIIPVVTAFALFINSVSGMLGLGVVIPYNPDRVEVAVSGDVVTDVDEIVARYNEAIKKGGFVIGRNGYEKFEVSNITFEDDSEEMKDLFETYESLFPLFTSSVTYSFELPGTGNLLASDIKSAKMSEKDGETTIIIELADNSESLARAYGWEVEEGSFENPFEETGYIVSMGDFELDYDNATIACVIDDSGKVIYGDWDYDFSFSSENIEVKIADMEMTMGFDLDCSAIYDI